MICKALYLFVLMQVCLPVLQARTFQEFLFRLNTLPAENRQAEVDSFLQVTESFPVTEDTLAHFIYSGTGQDLSVPGDFNGWDPAAAPMTSVESTNFWYRTDTLHRASRLDYKFVYNGSTWILDPRNPYTCPGGFGPNSELRMPDYIPPPEIEYYPDIPHGSLEDTTFASQNLGNSRRIQVYLPPGYNQGDAFYAMVLVHDGGEYLSLANMDHVLDYLISENRIDPLIAVFVPPVNRSPEYSGNEQDAFTRFIMEEVMPWVDAKYRTRSGPSSRATIGSSNGGNIALWIGMTYPEVFGNVGAFSSYVEPDIQTYFESHEMLDLRIYMNLGLYDHLAVIHSSVNGLVPVLDQKGYEYLFQTYPEGHSYGLWRAHLDDALEMFFPHSGSAVQEKPSGRGEFRLNQNYPNPFNAVTCIPIEIAQPGRIHLDIYDANGRHIANLADREYGSGKFEVYWDASDHASGIYLYQVRTGRKVTVQKMVLMR